jgi:predicted XRE-type DNA-binding protein
MSEVDFVKSSGNVFVDLGFDANEAAVMLIRVGVAANISRRIKDNGWTLDKVAHQFSITIQQASQITTTKIDDFSLDTLCLFAARLGIRLELTSTDN